MVEEVVVSMMAALIRAVPVLGNGHRASWRHEESPASGARVT